MTKKPTGRQFTATAVRELVRVSKWLARAQQRVPLLIDNEQLATLHAELAVDRAYFQVQDAIQALEAGAAEAVSSVTPV